ncbi:MAG: hypothetical protein ABJQ85_15045 [Rhizobiaceae bacterium]
MRQLHGWFAELVMNLTHLLLLAADHRPIPAPVLANDAGSALPSRKNVSGQNGTICRKILLGNHPVGHRNRTGSGVDRFIRNGFKHRRHRNSKFDSFPRPRPSIDGQQKRLLTTQLLPFDGVRF